MKKKKPNQIINLAKYIFNKILNIFKTSWFIYLKLVYYRFASSALDFNLHVMTVSWELRS